MTAGPTEGPEVWGDDDGNHLVGAVWCDLIGEISNRRELCICDEK